MCLDVLLNPLPGVRLELLERLLVRYSSRLGPTDLCRLELVYTRDLGLKGWGHVESDPDMAQRFEELSHKIGEADEQGFRSIVFAAGAAQICSEAFFRKLR